MSRALPMVFLLAAGLGLAGCGAGANPYPPVPPAKSETIPLPPVSGTEQLWEPGHWDWNGHGYDWIAGQWIARGGRSTTWQPGYWAVNKQTQTWTWRPGHWAQ
jgi:WXXGXW repeat (2 copies)